jgi:hypothetical protein
MQIQNILITRAMDVKGERKKSFIQQHDKSTPSSATYSNHQMVMHCHYIKKKKNSEYDLTTVARFSSPFSAKKIRSPHSSCYQGKTHNYSNTSFIQAKKAKY